MRLQGLDDEHRVMSEEEKEVVREQSNRLMASSYFSQSRRSVSFLRYVIDHALSGETEKLKERILGIEVFGRDGDYDTASDPIVRVTASEVRKRVAQYYQEDGHEEELRITLRPGAYVPEFQWNRGVPDPSLHISGDSSESHEPDTIARLVAAQIVEGPIEPSSAPPNVIPDLETRVQEPNLPAKVLHRSPRHYFALILTLACTAAAILWAGSAFFYHSIDHSAFEFFWGPILTTSDPVLICVSDQIQTSGITLRNPADPDHQVWLADTMQKNNFTTITLDDLKAILNIAPILQSRDKQFSVKGEGATNLADLRSGPAIFIGAFDNPWTLRLTNSLRFHFSSDASMTHLSIIDSKSPSGGGWAADRTVQLSEGEYRDYAIVARYTDGITGKLVVVIAGIGGGGTLAASQFLTDNFSLNQLEHAARAAGGKKNMEIVLSTQIINAQPGAPKIEAAYFW